MGKAQEGKPTTSRKGESRCSPAPAKVAAELPTPSVMEEGMEVEPLPRREMGEGADEVPADCSPPIEVESTLMEVAVEEPCDRN